MKIVGIICIWEYTLFLFTYNLHHVLDSIRQPESKPGVSGFTETLMLLWCRLMASFALVIPRMKGGLWTETFQKQNWFTGVFFWHGVQDLPGLRSLLKGESVLFERQKYLQDSELVAILRVRTTLQSPPHRFCITSMTTPLADLLCQLTWSIRVLVVTNSSELK